MEYILSEKYRPLKIEDVVLPKELSTIFEKMVKGGEIDNMTLAGSAGIGKSSVARALLKQIDADFIILNGITEGSIDTLRSKLTDFVSTVSFSGGRKYVLIEEADGMTARMQDGLKDFMEEYSENAGFILTTNHKNNLTDPILSRCPPIDFSIPKNEKEELIKKFFVRVKTILDNENIPYDKIALGKTVMNYFPDFRRTLNVIQTYSKTGMIDEGILAKTVNEDNIKKLCGLLKEKNFTEVRKWVTENSDIDSSALYTALYETLPDYLAGTASVASSVMVLAEYQYKEVRVANSEINRMAAMTSLMAECSWK